MGKERILGRDTQVHLEHTESKGPEEVQKPRRGETHRWAWGESTQAALTSLHVVKGARASCGISVLL